MTDERSSKLFIMGASAYLLVAVITFGHAFWHLQPWGNGTRNGGGAFLFAVIWPLYWSQWAFSPERSF